MASSIRRVTVGIPSVSAWIAKSIGGGVCVLVWDGVTEDNNSAVGFSCSTAEGLDKGASVQVPGIPSLAGKVLSVGVVPDSTTSVTTKSANGTTETTPVTNNAWAHISEAGPDGQAATMTQGG